MPKELKFFRVAKEGKTIDGREITRDQIVQMAATYDPKQKHGARVNIEHIRSMSPSGEFQGIGDVLALSTEEDKDGKLVLLAQIDPAPELVQLSKDRKKVYFSIEMYPNYQGTGIAYMGGLAMTDDPASAGTEMAKFSKHSGNDDSMISEGMESAVEFTAEDAGNSEDGNTPSLADRVLAIFRKEKDQDKKAQAAEMDQRFSKLEKDTESGVVAVAEEVTKLNSKLDDALKQLGEKTDEVVALSGTVDELGKKLDDALTQLSNEDAQPQRPPIAGAGNFKNAGC